MALTASEVIGHRDHCAERRNVAEAKAQDQRMNGSLQGSLSEAGQDVTIQMGYCRLYWPLRSQNAKKSSIPRPFVLHLPPGRGTTVFFVSFTCLPEDAGLLGRRCASSHNSLVAMMTLLY